jgi:hypothetical protein
LVFVDRVILNNVEIVFRKECVNFVEIVLYMIYDNYGFPLLAGVIIFHELLIFNF